MPSTRDIRRRIKSVKNTAQITKAMQMVAASKMRKAQQVALAGRPYATLMNEVLGEVAETVKEYSHPLMETRPVKKRAVILVSTDKGLCGGLNSNLMREAAKFCAELGFDGIDINMGCPDRSIEKQGAGAAMIKTPNIAADIIQAVKDGIADAKKDIPVSVKTRVGYNTIQIDEWIPFLLSQDIAALSVHARTRKEMSKVPARWEHIQQVVAIRDRMNVKTKIIGNGDVRDVAHGRMLARETGCDGIMIGRAIFGNPWLFANLHSEEILPAKSLAQGRRPEQNNFLARKYAWFLQAVSRSGEDSKDSHKYWLKTKSAVSIEERLRVLVEHTNLYMELLGDSKNFSIMKKHYKAYVNGFEGAKELRIKLMEAQSAEEVEAIVDNFLAQS